MNSLITAVEIARHAGLSDSTVRRILAPVYPKSEPRTRQKFEPEQLPELVALVKSRQQRHRMNANNATLKATGAK